MRRIEKILCWKEEQQEALVYFLTDNGLCGKIELPQDDTDEILYGLVPHMMYWEKWCPYTFQNMREDDPPQALRERLDRIVAECIPAFPIGGTEEKTLEQRDRMKDMIEEYEKAAEEEKLRKKTYRILSRFLKNEYWCKLYTEAPSLESRLYMALSFASGEEKNRYKMKQLEKLFSPKDWKFYMRYCGNNPRYAYAKKKMQELEDAQNAGAEERSAEQMLGWMYVDVNDDGSCTVQYEDGHGDYDYEANYTFTKANTAKLSMILSREYEGTLEEMMDQKFGKHMEKESLYDFCKEHNIDFETFTWIS